VAAHSGISTERQAVGCRLTQASETEGIGASVLADLQRQRETIGRTTTTFEEMEESHR
jgi:hypothetical protein